MVMLQIMMLSTINLLRDLMVDDQHAPVWEVCCSPNSWLSEACRLEGQRIKLANGFDLHKDETYQKMTQLYYQKRPQKI